MLLLVILIAISLVALFVILICTLCDWSWGKSYAKNVITFKTFKSFYIINPDRWDLHDDWVLFYKTCTSYGSYYGDYAFRFNYIDYLQYKIWKRKIEKQNEQIKCCKEMQEVLDIVKADLEKFNKDNATTMEKQLRDLWR